MNPAIMYLPNPDSSCRNYRNRDEKAVPVPISHIDRDFIPIPLGVDRARIVVRNRVFDRAGHHLAYVLFCGSSPDLVSGSRRTGADAGGDDRRY